MHDNDICKEMQVWRNKTETDGAIYSSRAAMQHVVGSFAWTSQKLTDRSSIKRPVHC